MIGALARLLIGRGATYDLTVASALNDLAAVRSMLDAAPSRISEQRPDDRRPLPAAAEFGRLDIVSLLLERGSDPTWPDADSSERGAALHAAAGRGDSNGGMRSEARSRMETSARLPEQGTTDRQARPIFPEPDAG